MLALQLIAYLSFASVSIALHLVDLTFSPSVNTGESNTLEWTMDTSDSVVFALYLIHDPQVYDPIYLNTVDATQNTKGQVPITIPISAQNVPTGFDYSIKAVLTSDTSTQIGITSHFGLIRPDLQSSQSSSTTTPPVTSTIVSTATTTSIITSLTGASQGTPAMSTSVTTLTKTTAGHATVISKESDPPKDQGSESDTTQAPITSNQSSSISTSPTSTSTLDSPGSALTAATQVNKTPIIAGSVAGAILVILLLILLLIYIRRRAKRIRHRENAEFYRNRMVRTLAAEPLQEDSNVGYTDGDNESKVSLTGYTSHLYPNRRAAGDEGVV